MRVRGRYRNQAVELATPLTLPEGTEVEVEVIVSAPDATGDTQAWQELAMSRLEEEWDNPEDAVYDNWRRPNSPQRG